MRLRDTVDVLRAGETVDPYNPSRVTPKWTSGVTTIPGVPAEVVFVTVASIQTATRNALVEELRAVIPPMDFDPAWNRLRWRGKLYSTDAPPMIRRRNGADHHLTISLKLVTG